MSALFVVLFVVLLVVGFVVTYWWLILAALAVVVAACLGWWSCKHSDAADERERREHAALVARADQQHAWVLAGDDRGTDGDYHQSKSLELARSEYRAPAFMQVRGDFQARSPDGVNSP